MLEDEIGIHWLEFGLGRGVGLRHEVTFGAFEDVLLGVPVDAGPGDVALKDGDESLVAWMARKDAAMGIPQHGADQLGWNDRLQNRRSCRVCDGLSIKDPLLDDQALEVLLVK